MEYLH